MIRVIIADDHHLVRQGIRALLEKEKDFEVVNEAVDGQEAVEQVRQLAPDVLVMDIAMPRLNGIEALTQLSAMKTTVQTVILSMYSDDVLVRQALDNGAKGFVLKGSVAEDLLLAIRAANRGAAYLSPAISEAIRNDSSAPQESGSKFVANSDKLTLRERETLRLICKGHTNNQMAKIMHISVKTVERHRSNLMDKLNAHNLVELIRIGIRHGLIRFDD